MDDHSDDSLLGDEIQLVSFKIMYVEENHEAVLCESEEVVDAHITSTAFSALKMSDFLQSLAEGTSIPNTWRDGKHPGGNFGYSPNAEYPKTYSLIPEHKQRFLRVSFQILSRKLRGQGENDQRQRKALDAIRKSLGD